MAEAAGLPVGGTNSATAADASCISVRAATPDALSAATSGRAATGEELLAGAAGLSIGGTTGSLTGATRLPRLPIGGTSSAGGTKRLATLSPRDEADSDSPRWPRCPRSPGRSLPSLPVGLSLWMRRGCFGSGS